MTTYVQDSLFLARYSAAKLFSIFFVFVGLNKNNLVIGLLCLIARGHNGANIFLSYFLNFYSQKIFCSIQDLKFIEHFVKSCRVKMTSKGFDLIVTHTITKITVCIRTVSFQLILSSMHNWFKQFMGSLGRATYTIHSIDQFGIIQMYR